MDWREIPRTKALKFMQTGKKLQYRCTAIWSFIVSHQPGRNTAVTVILPLLAFNYITLKTFPLLGFAVNTVHDRRERVIIAS
ncbi:hypothetical protein EZJ58_2212 [Sodalis ligni]|uniref:Uncharacterized protein n=1 Tax=Sodalis ligni TaxID=2697027 RepID=A0A4R1N9M9_9GAMM|nr:hypothetical protein EZJ58_2212 [Sodalis ligni]